MWILRNGSSIHIESCVHSKYLFCLFILSLCYVIGHVLWAGMDNAKKALPEAENRSRVELHDDSGIFNSLNLLLV